MHVRSLGHVPRRAPAGMDPARTGHPPCIVGRPPAHPIIDPIASGGSMHHPLHRVTVAAALAVLLAAPAARAQSLLPDFPVTNGSVYTQALLGNTLYLGGDFTWIGRASG